MKKKIDWGSDNEFIAKYTELKSSRKMAQVYKCDKQSVLAHAKSIGFNVNNLDRQYKLSTADKANIINSYNTKSSNELAAEYNVSRGMITKLWYDAQLNGKEHRLYKLEHQDFFSAIDTDEKAYWLGFIMADGCVSDFHDGRASTISIALSIKDKAHLEKFLQAIGSDKQIYIDDYNCKQRASIQISSKKLTDDLKKLGCVPRKTLLNTWVDLHNDDLQFAFIRGYFDGDGSISGNFDINTLYRVNIAIAGYQKNLNNFITFLGMHGIKSVFQKDNRTNKYSSNEEFGSLIISNKQHINAFLELVYPNECACYLDRKYILANKFKLLYAKSPRSWELNNTNADIKSGKIGEILQIEQDNTEVTN